MAFAVATASQLERCEPWLLSFIAGTREVYETGMTRACELESPFEGHTGQVVIDEEAVLTCLHQVANAPCGCTGEEMPACGTLNLPNGTLADGAVCEIDSQCASGYCSIMEDEDCGICATLPGLGEDCSDEYLCGEGLTCNYTSFTCQEKKLRCETCASDDECGELVCVRGECASAYLAEGEDCTDSRSGCAEGLSCNEDVCGPISITFSELGAPCNILDMGPPLSITTCNGLGHCNAEENGTCQARGFENDPCTILDDEDTTCMIFLECVGSVCVYPEPPVCE